MTIAIYFCGAIHHVFLLLAELDHPPDGAMAVKPSSSLSSSRHVFKLELEEDLLSKSSLKLRKTFMVEALILLSITQSLIDCSQQMGAHTFLKVCVVSTCHTRNRNRMILTMGKVKD